MLWGISLSIVFNENQNKSVPEIIYQMVAHINSCHSYSETFELSSLESKRNPYMFGLPDR